MGLLSSGDEGSRELHFDNVDKVSSMEQLTQFDYLIGYHGTTHRLRDSIRSSGLRPRGDTDLEAVDPSLPSQEGLVYFSALEKSKTGLNHCVNKARQVVGLAGGKPMILECKLDIRRLVIDEDMKDYGAETVLDSLHRYTVAHKGAVHPSKGKGSFINSAVYVSHGGAVEIFENDEELMALPPHPKEHEEKLWEQVKKIRSKNPRRAAEYKKNVEQEWEAKYATQISLEKFRSIVEQNS